MAKHVLLVFSDPTEGQEDEYNRWYNEVHLKEVIATPGFVNAQRFKVADVMPGATDHKYLAIYEVDTDDAKKAVEALTAELPNMNMSKSINTKTAKMSILTECSPLVEN